MNQTKAEACELASIIRRHRPDLAIDVGPIGDDWVIHLPGLPAEQVASILAAAESERRAQAEAIRGARSLRPGQR